MDTEGGGLAEGRAELRFREALVVESVASFVEDTVEGDHEIGFIVAGSHAGVARSESRAEWVGTGVETTSGDVETDFREEGVEKLFL